MHLSDARNGEARAAFESTFLVCSAEDSKGRFDLTPFFAERLPVNSASVQRWPGCIRMRLKANQILMVVAGLAAFSGCQSGPRWAWWNHNKASDASVAAHSTEPALPSAQ